jgi:23S rRNA (cytidine1920-2'-O)/16S rRNA (cytidine1409-2'-O)-methyltransferase
LARSKERLDVRLAREGHFESRELARRAIMAGKVRVAGHSETKPGTLVAADAVIAIARPAVPYVSRGGVKLDHALSLWPVDVADRVALDVGSSTGGFTDVLLRRGARRVFAVDVGYGQLAWSLRQDSRVVVRERTHIARLRPDDLYAGGEPARLATVDVSFIGLTKVLPAIKDRVSAGLRPGERADVVALIKPQFEAGRREVGKKGVVRDPAVREAVVASIAQMARGLGFAVEGVETSPIAGREGNVEFLIWLSLCG